MAFHILLGVFLVIPRSGANKATCNDDEIVPHQDDFSLLQARSEQSSTGLLSWKDAWDAEPNMFDNCSNVFVDVGSNRGTHIRKLYEPEKYPRAKYLKVFDAAFGPEQFRRQASSKTGICAFGFEANPRWTSRFREIEAAYSKHGWRAKWFAPMVVSNDTGDATFWLNNKGAKSDTAASVINHKIRNHKHVDARHSVTVPTVDFANFIDALSKHALPGYKLVKMDIEGSEFDVLPHLIERSLLCEGSINKMTIEWHFRFLMSDESSKAAREIKREVLSGDRCSPKRDTQVVQIDDESYRNDGMPLPV
jgi:FkbM family methyltransferase